MLYKAVTEYTNHTCKHLQTLYKKVKVRVKIHEDTPRFHTGRGVR